MGLTDLVAECSGVFVFLYDFWSTIPVAIQSLVYVSFGCVAYISVLRSIWR